MVVTLEDDDDQEVVRPALRDNQSLAPLADRLALAQSMIDRRLAEMPITHKFTPIRIPDSALDPTLVGRGASGEKCDRWRADPAQVCTLPAYQVDDGEIWPIPAATARATPLVAHFIQARADLDRACTEDAVVAVFLWGGRPQTALSAPTTTAGDTYWAERLLSEPLVRAVAVYTAQTGIMHLAAFAETDIVPPCVSYNDAAYTPLTPVIHMRYSDYAMAVLLLVMWAAQCECQKAVARCTTHWQREVLYRGVGRFGQPAATQDAIEIDLRIAAECIDDAGSLYVEVAVTNADLIGHRCAYTMADLVWVVPSRGVTRLSVIPDKHRYALHAAAHPGLFAPYTGKFKPEKCIVADAGPADMPVGDQVRRVLAAVIDDAVPEIPGYAFSVTKAGEGNLAGYDYGLHGTIVGGRLYIQNTKARKLFTIAPLPTEHVDPVDIPPEEEVAAWFSASALADDPVMEDVSATSLCMAQADVPGWALALEPPLVVLRGPATATMLDLVRSAQRELAAKRVVVHAPIDLRAVPPTAVEHVDGDVRYLALRLGDAYSARVLPPPAGPA